MSSLFFVIIGNTSVCVKTISSGIKKVLFSRAHISGHSPGCYSVCSFDSWCLPGSILQAGDWGSNSTPARHYFSTYISTTDWHKDLVHHTALGLTEWAACWSVSNIVLIKVLYISWALRPWHSLVLSKEYPNCLCGMHKTLGTFVLKG